MDMNEDRASQTEADVDPQVSDRYRSLAREETPADLDLAVLNEAKRAVRADNRQGSFGPWFRPVAFAATVLLSLAIIIDIINLETPGPPAAIFDATTSAPTRPATDEPAETTYGTRSQAILNEIKRQEKSAAGGPQSGDATGSMREIADDAKAMPGEIAEPVPGRRSKLTATAPHAEIEAAVRSASNSLAQAQACSAKQRSTPESWWQCIVSLRESGRNDAYEVELEKLKERFPEFSPAE